VLIHSPSNLEHQKTSTKLFGNPFKTGVSSNEDSQADQSTPNIEPVDLDHDQSNTDSKVVGLKSILKGVTSAMSLSHDLKPPLSNKNL